MLQKSDISHRIESFIQQKGWSKAEFARRMGIFPQHVNKYLTGEFDFFNLIEKLEIEGCDIDWLMTGKQYIDASINDVKPRQVELRLLGSIPAGRSEMHIHEWISVETLDLDPNNHELLMIDKEFGYSMRPFMNPGDLVVISYKDPVEDGCLVAARWDDTKGAIKILGLNKKDFPGLVFLHSTNNIEPTITLRRDQVFMYRVIGWFDRNKRRGNRIKR